MGITAERVANTTTSPAKHAGYFSGEPRPRNRGDSDREVRDEIVPVRGRLHTPNGNKPKRTEIVFKMDDGPRADTTLEALLALKPAFHAKGTITAGNSSQMSDGAAAAMVMSAERAKALG